MQDNQYKVHGVIGGKSRYVEGFPSLESAEQYIDGIVKKLDDLYFFGGSAPIEKIHGRIEHLFNVKNPLEPIDYWEVNDIDCRGLFQFVIVKTSDLTRELAQ
tara:strand:- start:1236 stop:1541 length:306 start_codon:yes stop_codon:yes gene_type:complete